MRRLPVYKKWSKAQKGLHAIYIAWTNKEVGCGGRQIIVGSQSKSGLANGAMEGVKMASHPLYLIFHLS